MGGTSVGLAPFAVPAPPPVPKPGRRETTPTSVTPLPDPLSFGSALVELGDLSLPMRVGSKGAKAGKDAASKIEDIAARLLRHGAVRPYLSSPAQEPSDVSGQLWLNDVLFAVCAPRTYATGINHLSRHIAAMDSSDEGEEGEGPQRLYDDTPNLVLRRMRSPDAAPRSATVPYRIVVAASDGRAAPTEHAVQVSRQATPGELLAAVASACGLGADERLVLVNANKIGSAWRLREFVTGAEVVGNATMPWVSYEAYGQGRPAALKLRLPARATKPRYLAYRLPVPSAPDAPAFAVVWLRERFQDVSVCGGYAPRTKTMPLGMPLLLPLPPDWLAGGAAAQTALEAALSTALKPLLKDGAAWANPASLTRCNPSGMPEMQPRDAGFDGDSMDEDEREFDYEGWLYGHMHMMGEEDEEEDEEEIDGTPVTVAAKPDAAVPGGAPALIYVAATYDRAELRRMFDPELLATPAQAPSAVADADGDKIAAAEAEQDEFERNAGKQIVTELLRAVNVRWVHVPARGTTPATQQAAHYHHSLPLLRYTLTLSADAPSSATGTLGIKLFALRGQRDTSSTFYTAPVHASDVCQRLFEDPACAGQPHDPDGMLAASSLQGTLGLLWRQRSSAFRQNQADWEAPKASTAGNTHVCTLPGLLAALETKAAAEAPQPPGLNVQLRPHQKQALKFCCDAEDGGSAQMFWCKASLPDGSVAWYSKELSMISLTEPPCVRGGWLCQEMGLGKTVITLALVLANPQMPPAAALAAPGGAGLSSVPPAGDAAVPAGMLRSSATLVVCAVSLVGQWMAEAQSKLDKGPAGTSLRIVMYHGQNRIKDVKKLANDYDVVVTTYQTLGADFSHAGGKANPNCSFPPLGRIHWHRVVLDESHTIASPKPLLSQACIRLSASRRWCVTGTPMGNSVEDLRGQIDFLRLSPWTSGAYFDLHAKRVFGTTGNRYGGNPLVLLYTLSRCMCRHTKAQQLGGVAVLELPPKTDQTIECDFTADERKAYDQALMAARAQFNKIAARGVAAVSNSLLSIMLLLNPLRRICSGGALTAKDVQIPDLAAMAAARAAAKAAELEEDQKQSYGDVKPNLPAGGPAGGAGPSAPPDAPPQDVKPVLAMIPVADEECGLCAEICDEPVRTGCQHWFCSDCFLSALPVKKADAKCPTCKKAADPSALQAAAGAEAAADAKADAKGKGKVGAKGKPASLRPRASQPRRLWCSRASRSSRSC